VTEKSVLILGAGTGGLVVASRLRRMLGKEHHVVMVDRSPFYTFEPSLPWVMTGNRNVPQITRDLRTLAKKGIEFLPAEVIGLDLDHRVIHTPNRDFSFDFLVIALGAQYSSEEVPGLNHAWTFYHPDGAEGLRDKLAEFPGGRVAVCVPSLPYKCPPGPYEGALLLDAWLEKHGLREACELHIYTPDDAPLSIAGPDVSGRLSEMLSSRRIGYTGGVTLKSINHQKGLLNFDEGEPAGFDLLVATPIHRVPDVLRDSGLIGNDGWVAVNPEQLHTVAEGVYAIGDCTGIPIADGRSLPKSGVFAHGQAEVVARNIVAEMGGHDPIWAFGGQGACFMETGHGKATYIVGNYYADPPQVTMKSPGRLTHWSKIGFEKTWLWRWF
jgi:sulfide:quinone oxidoreductase